MTCRLLCVEYLNAVCKTCGNLANHHHSSGFGFVYEECPCKGKGKVNRVWQLAASLTATGTHILYRITQCYLPPGRGNIPTLTPAEAGTPEGCMAELT